MKKTILILILSILAIPNLTFAHPGRTDSSGGHTCRTNCTSWGLSSGEYHYHRSKGVPQTKEPVKSIRNEGGVGQTVPAPEYKTPKKTTIDTASTITDSVYKTTVNTVHPAPAPVEEKSWVKRFFNWLF